MFELFSWTEWLAIKNFLITSYFSTSLNCLAGWYDAITVGAFTAYAQKYKHGGLSRLLSQLQESHSTENNSVTNLSLACDLVNSIYDHKMSISKDCDTLCRLTSSGTAEEMTEITNSLQQKVHNSQIYTFS